LLALLLLLHLYKSLSYTLNPHTMKKLFLYLGFLATSATSFAQDEAGGSRIDVRKLRFGAFAAPTISWMRPTTNTDDRREFNVESDGSITGFMWGLMVDYNFAPNYAIATGVQYNTTGGKILANAVNTDTRADAVQMTDFRYRLAYLEVPLHLKLRTDDLSGFRFFGQLGFTGGINIGKKADYSVDYWDENSTPRNASGEEVKLKGGIGNIAPVLLQLNVGGGAEYAIGEKLSAYFGVFFNNGFVPDATNPQDFDEALLGYRGEFRDGNTRLNNVSFKVGLFF
jgi:hypothetical protein